MTLENQNNEEYKLKKPENLYAEEPNIENASESTGNNIETELNQLGQKQQVLEANLEAVGGEEGVKKIWSEMDENKKIEITNRIKTYVSDKESSNKNSKDMLIGSGLSAGLAASGVLGFLFPTAFPGGEVYGLSGMDRAELTALVFGSGGLIMTAGFSFATIKEKIRGIKSAIALKREKKNLQKLEAQYK